MALTRITSAGISDGVIDVADISDNTITGAKLASDIAISTTGTITTSQVNLGDNDKAQFGASNDLQIYHNATNSVIDEQGAGQLLVRSNGDGIFFQNGDSTASIASFRVGTSNEFFYNGAKKLETTSSGATISGRLLITEGTPQIKFTDTDNNADAYIQATDGNLRFFADDGQENASSNISFAVDGSEKARIDSSGNVSIGKTSSAGKSLELYASTNAAMRIQNSTTGTGALDGLLIEIGGSNALIYNYENGALRFGTNNAEKMRINSSGNVGIGTTSPTDLLDVRGSIKARDASDNVGRFHTRNAFTVTNGTSVQLTSVCGSAMVCVSCNTTGAGGLFWGNFSTTVSKLAGDGLTSDSGTSDIAVYKNSSSNLMYFKNRSGFSRDYVITVYAARHA